MWSRTRLRLLLFVTIISIGAGSLSKAAADDEPSPNDPAFKVLEVWKASSLLQFPILRLAVAESHIEESAKRKGAEFLLTYESELRKMVADAQKNPASAGQILEKVQTFRHQQDPQMLALFTKEQYEEIGKRNSAIALQLTALSSDPQSVLTTVNKSLKLTPAQKEKIDPAVAHLADRLKSFKADLEHANDPATRIKKAIEGFESIEAAAIEVRSQLRQSLAAEQLKRFDSAFSSGTANDAKEQAGQPTTGRSE
jgi:hypothetical protein